MSKAYLTRLPHRVPAVHWLPYRSRTRYVYCFDPGICGNIGSGTSLHFLPSLVLVGVQIHNACRLNLGASWPDGPRWYGGRRLCAYTALSCFILIRRSTSSMSWAYSDRVESPIFEMPAMSFMCGELSVAPRACVHPHA